MGSAEAERLVSRSVSIVSVDIAANVLSVGVIPTDGLTDLTRGVGDPRGMADSGY